MSSYAELRAGPIAVHQFADRPGDELLAVFRDDMQATRRERQDWSGLRLIIDAIYAAARRSSGPSDLET